MSTDTRALRPHQLFLALSGPNFDGNAFAEHASRLGAGALLLRGRPGSSLPHIPGDIPLVVHAEPRRALSDIATWHRRTLEIPVVGITGSCGKTTTKNILAQLLSTRMRTVASPNSFNNDIGVPHTLLLADATTQALVLEIGTNASGEIAQLCRVAEPTGGIVTMIGASHLEGLGSIEGVAREKSALLASLPSSGFAVINVDSRHADLLRAATRARVITVSVEGEGELNATQPLFHAGGTTFKLLGHEVTSPLLGVHNISNLLCALAACRGMGIDCIELLPAISQLKGGSRRMERHEVGHVVLFDDTYNANPESARAAVRFLAGLHGKGRRVLVLGDMLELGANAPELHHAVGRDAASAGIDLLVLVGELVRATAAGALEAGMNANRVVHLENADSATNEMGALLRQGDTVLLKASRRVGLDRVVDHLRARAHQARV
ncbi:MAG: UDP-N-acetylmuramoyl-tripeptide--D-alanyl-D-alanine ligase [Planctomycetes bacterium]|nr:UDP-N-acetylmuramoyl-tripeptide--D-alanyl-D-alanine ligase [Planctomycetota bacterium]